MLAMIQIDSVTKAYGENTLLDNVSVIIGKNEKCGLIGRNGSGKTTLFRMITGQEEPDSGSITYAKNYRLGYLSQHIHFSKASLLEEAALGLTEDDKDNTYKAEAILFGLGFQKQDLERSPLQFSGGYHLRLHLAKLLLSEPDCLLLDEPTNYLDILSIRWLTKFLKSWPKEMIVVSHDRQFLDEIITHTIGIHRKGIKKFAGPTVAFFEQIAALETVHEKTRLAIEKKREHLQSFVERFGAKNTKAAQAQSRVKAMKRLPALETLCQIENLYFAFPSIETNSKILLSTSELAFRYNVQQTPLISGVNLEIEREARLGIIGKNGKGKSTLLRLLFGELTPLSGSIKSMNGLSIGYFGQSHIDSLPKDRTIEEEIKLANPALSFQEVRNIAGKMMFPGTMAEKKIGFLSGGERSRVVLGKLLARPCHLLLLDEPTNHLDVESMEAFMDALEEFAGALCIVTHSELVLDRLADRLFVFREDKQEIFLGTYSDFLQKGGWQEEEKTPVKRESSLKDEKRQRAELVTERARLLKPHLNKIQELEKQIIALEDESTKLQPLLLDAINSNKSAQIGEYSKKSKDNEREIERLFTELEEVHKTAQAIKDMYEQKL